MPDIAEGYTESERAAIYDLGRRLGIAPTIMGAQPRDTLLALKRTSVKWLSRGWQASVDTGDDVRTDTYRAALGRERSDWPIATDLVSAFAELDSMFAERVTAADVVRASAWAWMRYRTGHESGSDGGPPHDD